MSKRKNRSVSPNLPQEALERARRQIAEERGETVEPEKPVQQQKPAPPPKPAPAAPYRPVTETRSRRAPEPVAVSSGRVSQRRAARRDETNGKPEALDMETVRYHLQHPTKIVTPEELRQQYGYVASDLRRIGLLAAALIVVLIVIAQFA
jgi:outer membrane biosynthesis protein TonB